MQVPNVLQLQQDAGRIAGKLFVERDLKCKASGTAQEVQFQRNDSVSHLQAKDPDSPQPVSVLHRCADKPGIRVISGKGRTRLALPAASFKFEELFDPRSSVPISLMNEVVQRSAFRQSTLLAPELFSVLSGQRARGVFFGIFGLSYERA